MTLKTLKKATAFFLLLTTSINNLQAQERGIEINSKRNADKSVDFTYEKKIPGTYTVKIKFNSLRNTIADEFKAVVKHSTGSLLTLKPERPDQHINYAYSTSYTRGDENAKIDSLFQYTLPYKDGKEIQIIESGNVGEKYLGKEKHKSWKSYSVTTKTPDSIFAMRKGIVIEIKNEYPTDTLVTGYIYTSKRNGIIIEHEDGTYGSYWGLKMDSMPIELGDTVYPSTLLGVIDRFNNKNYVLHFHIYYIGVKDYVFDQNATLKTAKTRFSYLTPFFHTKEGIVQIISKNKYTAHCNQEILTKEMSKKELKKFLKTINK